MLESRLNKWISGIVAAATLATPMVAYAERLPVYLNSSASIENRYHLLDSSSGISGIEEIAQQKPCPPQLSYLPECQQQLRQQQSAPTYVPPNQQPSPQPVYVPPSQPTYQPSYSAPPEKEEKKDNTGWYLIGGGVAVVLTGMALSTGYCTGEESYGEDPCENVNTPMKIASVVGLGLIIWGIIDLNTD